MNRREEGFLLLTASLGDPRRRPLTASQLKTVKRCILRCDGCFSDKELEWQDLANLGCPETLAQKTVELLSGQKKLEVYLEQGRAQQCTALTRISRNYPFRLISCLGEDAPGCLWLKGDPELLNRPAVALVGSRELGQDHAAFARQVGFLAARNGYVLVSGNARGADTLAQESCLEAGGRVISVIADRLTDKKLGENVLYISEEGYDLPFTSRRALSRNHLIHCLGQRTFVARCNYGTGGTWKGTLANLESGWSPVFCFSDGSEGALYLQQHGAGLIGLEQLHDGIGG